MSGSGYKAQRIVKSLPLKDWPTADQQAWIEACRPGQRLKRGGAAAHLKEITRKDLVRRYGYFLDFIKHMEGLNSGALTAAYVTRSRIASFLQELQARVSSVTTYGTIYKVRRMSQLLAPEVDLRWLIEIEKDLALVMEPSSKFGRLRYAHVIADAGAELMAGAEAAVARSALSRARMFRNGLMIALLAYHPIRLKNFAFLEIGQTLKLIAGTWWIILDEADTKEGRADERQLDRALVPSLTRYLSVHRLSLARGKAEHAALWLSSNDASPMSYNAVERVIKQTTLTTLGVDISPHLFRTSGSSTAATFLSEKSHLGSALLHHRDPRVNGEHYNRAKTFDAATRYTALLRTMQI